MHAEIKNPTSMEVNPAIGSGFDASRGTFQGDQVTSPSPEVDHVNDHPFHNVDYNTMMVRPTIKLIPIMYYLGHEKGPGGSSEGQR